MSTAFETGINNPIRASTSWCTIGKIRSVYVSSHRETYFLLRHTPLVVATPSPEFHELLWDVKDMLWETENSDNIATFHLVSVCAVEVNRKYRASIWWSLPTHTGFRRFLFAIHSPEKRTPIRRQKSNPPRKYNGNFLLPERYTRRNRESAGSRYPHEGIVIRPFLIRKVTLQAEKDGTCTVTFKSDVSPSSDPVEVERHGVVEGILPMAQIGWRTSIRPRENVTMRGDVALGKIPADMQKQQKIRHWFCHASSMALFFKKTSGPFDGFIPGLVKRTNRGIELPEPFPLYYFEVVGGATATVGSVVIFKRFDQGDGHEVKIFSMVRE